MWHVEHPIRRFRCRAAFPMFTGMGRVAVCVGFHFRSLGPRQAAELRLEPCLDANEPLFSFALYVHAAEELWPRYAVQATDVLLIDVENLDRRKTHAYLAENMNLYCHVVIVVVLNFATTLHLPHPPVPAWQALQNIDADAHTGMLESSFKDRRHGAVSHQGGSACYRLGMFPRRFLDQDASRKQAVRLPPDFKSNILH